VDHLSAAILGTEPPHLTDQCADVGGAAARGLQSRVLPAKKHDLQLKVGLLVGGVIATERVARPRRCSIRLRRRKLGSPARS